MTSTYDEGLENRGDLAPGALHPRRSAGPMTDRLDRRAIEKAFAILNDHGIDASTPWEGDLDDLERERYEAFSAACRAYANEILGEFVRSLKGDKRSADNPP